MIQKLIEQGNQLGLSFVVPVNKDYRLLLNSPDSWLYSNSQADKMLITLKYESVDMRVYNIYKLDMHLTKYATAYYRRSKALDSEEYLLSCIEFNTDVTVKGIGVFGVDWVSHRSIDEFSETLRDLVLYQASSLIEDRFCYTDNRNELDRVSINKTDKADSKLNNPCYVWVERQVNIGQVGNAQRQQQIIVHLKKSDNDRAMYSQDGHELDITVDYAIVRKPLPNGRYKYRIASVQLNQDMVHNIEET